MSTSIPFGESITLSLTNSKHQYFEVWCEPAKTEEQITLSLNYRKELLQTLVLIPSPKHSNRVILDYRFDAEAIFVDSTGKVEEIRLLTVEEQKKEHFMDIDRYKYVLLAVPGYAELFSIKAQESYISICKEINYNKYCKTDDSSRKEPLLNLEKLTFKDILREILDEKDGCGLRSRIPAYYVWYNDILFLVKQLSFPGYCATFPVRENTLLLYDYFKKQDVKVVMKEAVYPRQFVTSHEKITPGFTWYGMECSGKFVTTNLVPGFSREHLFLREGDKLKLL
jgi:hypothetical protein